MPATYTRQSGIRQKIWKCKSFNARGRFISRGNNLKNLWQTGGSEVIFKRGGFMGNGLPENGRRRVVIENVAPQIDGGCYAIKRTAGEKVIVEADIFADGHDTLSAVAKFRHEKNSDWSEIEMKLVENDRWRAEFTVEEIGNYFFTVEAWVDHFKSWGADLQKRLNAKQDVAVDLLVGANLIEAAATRARELDAETLRSFAKELREGQYEKGMPVSNRALGDELVNLMSQFSDRSHATICEHEFRVSV